MAGISLVWTYPESSSFSKDLKIYSYFLTKSGLSLLLTPTYYFALDYFGSA
jgi:hypothetical protein